MSFALGCLKSGNASVECKSLLTLTKVNNESSARSKIAIDLVSKAMEMKLLKRMAQVPFLPHQIQHRVMNEWMRRQFGKASVEGDLQFLRGRFLSIHIDEIDFDLCLTLGKNSPVVINGDVVFDATISGSLESFLLLAEQEVDPDTLFFQRKLSVEGDTEFALEVKNLLYRVEWLPESKRLAQSIHAMQRAFNRLPTFLPGPTKNH